MESISKNLVHVDIEEELKKSFISYAMAVIINRALPDVRDGLKPVHRRILYSMNELSLTPDKPFRKCARIVGDVLGKFHPHGDSAVYESLVRMAQDFSMRAMLVQGHGNFGSIDGDSAAAMRYTEARLSRIAMEMLRDLDKDTVDFVPNFDETEMQPSVLPARYPNLLVNGSGGIAVGMATNIPPHNLGETIDATCALIDNPDLEVADLLQYIPGPDFPTGGIIMGTAGIRSAYSTGRGRVVVRARTETEVYGSGKSRIIVTELPYQVNKARLVEKTAELVHNKIVEGISDLRDESDRSGMRIVIELKRDVNAQVVLNKLYKHTQLQDTFGVIMLALLDGEPKVFTLKQMLMHYIEHQQDVVKRRTKYELEKAKARAHILEGLLIALSNIDEVVEIIKKSPTTNAAREALIQRFGLSEKQSQAILDMRLARLTGLEREKIEKEYADIQAQIEYLTRILTDHAMMMGIIKDELLEIKRRYADPRRSEITVAEDEIDMDDIIQREDMVVTLTHFGYIKRLSADTYRTQRRGGKGVSAHTTREEDFIEHVFVTSTHSDILFFTNMGRAFKLRCYHIPEASRQAKGIPIVNLLQLNSGEKISAVFPIGDQQDAELYLTMATRNGVIKKTTLADFRNIRRGGLIAIALREDDELIRVLLTDGTSDLIVGTRHGKSIRFPEGQVRAMGRVAMGVRSINLQPGDYVVDMEPIAPGDQVLVITENGMGKRTDEQAYRTQSRGGKGILIMNLNEKTGPLVGLKTVTSEHDIMMIRDDGTIIRMDVDEISLLSRNTQGVRLMRVDGGTRVVCVEKVLKREGDEGESPFDDSSEE